MSGTTARRVWAPGFPVSLPAVLGSLRRGPGDPAFRRTPTGVIYRATRTPQGPALLRLEERPAHAQIVAQAWGAGAEWILDGVPALLGAQDNPQEFAPLAQHCALVAAHRANPGWRIGRTGLVFEALVPAVLEQRVTGQEAYASWRRLLYRFGEVAPGPGGTPGTDAAGMRVPPCAQQWAAVPSWEWLQAGVEQARSRVVMEAAAVAGRLEESLEVVGEQAAARLRVVPGIGVWTAAEIRQRAHGDPDAFSFSDFHVAKNVTWALTGQVGDDAECARLIEPYRGHRYRVQALLALAGAARPRRGPRMTLPTHLP